METILDGEEQRSAAVFEIDNNNDTITAIAAEMAVAEPEIQTLEADVEDDELFDVVDAIMQAPPEFVAEEDVNEAFDSILQSNGFEAAEIEAILSDQAQVGVEAQSGVQPNDPLAVTTNDDGDIIQTVGAVDNADVDAGEGIPDVPVNTGVEAETGAANTEDDAAALGDSSNACAAMQPVDDNSDDTDADMDMPAVDMAGCMADDIDWTTPGENGLSMLGEVVQAFQDMVDATGDPIPMLPPMNACMPVPPCQMDMMMNDMADNAMFVADDTAVDVDVDI